jgi:hypothetical protein
LKSVLPVFKRDTDFSILKMTGNKKHEQEGVISMSKYVYEFGGGSAEGAASDKNLLGGKGANLAEMCSLGIPVPAGFTVSTEC